MTKAQITLDVPQVNSQNYAPNLQFESAVQICFSILLLKPALQIAECNYMFKSLCAVTVQPEGGPVPMLTWGARKVSARGGRTPPMQVGAGRACRATVNPFKCRYTMYIYIYLFIYLFIYMHIRHRACHVLACWCYLLLLRCFCWFYVTYYIYIYTHV